MHSVHTPSAVIVDVVVAVGSLSFQMSLFFLALEGSNGHGYLAREGLSGHDHLALEDLIDHVRILGVTATFPLSEVSVAWGFLVENVL